MNTNYTPEQFIEWYTNGLKNYLDSQYSRQYTVHIEDLMYATAAYSEAITAFIASKPKGL